MAYSHYDRLTALDSTFLEIEDANVHMHVGSVGIFEAGPLATPEGGLDIGRIRRMAGASLAKSRRFRQRIARIPLLDHPVWVDDERFNLDYHLRHTALPAPGDERQLKRLVGRLLSQKLDIHKPLWEMWFVEGLDGDRFALITKVHHCMIDGISGVDLMALLMQPEPETGEGEHEATRWIPRPSPSSAKLLADEALRRAALPLGLLRAGRDAVAEPGRTFEAARAAVGGASELIGSGITPASRTPLNPAIGPHRRFDWTRIDLGAVKEVKDRLGGTVNDVVLATVAGAVRAFLEGRGTLVDDLDFRAQVPVNIRAAEQRRKLGNRVATLVVPLPVHEPDARRRYELVLETTQRLKHSSQVHGSELLEQLGDWTAKELLGAIVRGTAQKLAFNMTVTNVPGPQFPVYLLGSRMLEVYPVVPLFSNQALGIALFSYDGALYWGFNSDWDVLPDLHEVVSGVQNEFELLRKL
jgi:WS/DGAT/MGAT family acyltransferase